MKNLGQEFVWLPSSPISPLWQILLQLKTVVPAGIVYQSVLREQLRKGKKNLIIFDAMNS
jgi:hypothetical protein